MEENRCENKTFLRLKHRKDTYVALAKKKDTLEKNHLYIYILLLFMPAQITRVYVYHSCWGSFPGKRVSLGGILSENGACYLLGEQSLS